LSRYTEPLRAAIDSGALRIEPAARRREVLAFLAGGLRDFSISRSQARARGWGLPVPGDPSQVIYVWWDALGNYLTSLGYGGAGESTVDRWWTGADRRVHLIGKGVLRFHAVYWPAMLLSAGLPLPTDIWVHDYLTVDGQKISKSTGIHADPAALVAAHGVDAVRWWLLREVPRVGDVDFTEARLAARAAEDLAGGFGNVVNRVVTMVHRFRGGTVPPPGPPDDDAKALAAACERAPAEIDAAFAGADFRTAAAALLAIVDEANRYIEASRPWALARAGDRTADARLDTTLYMLVAACRTLARELAPFLPDAAARIAAQCLPRGDTGRLPDPLKVFARVSP
jgi:methionyl-tRNA synthetase